MNISYFFVVYCLVSQFRRTCNQNISHLYEDSFISTNNLIPFTNSIKTDIFIPLCAEAQIFRPAYGFFLSFFLSQSDLYLPTHCRVWGYCCPWSLNLSLSLIHTYTHTNTHTHKHTHTHTHTHTHYTTLHPVGLPWTSDRLVAETSTLQRISPLTYRHLLPLAKFEPAIPASEVPQTYALDNVATRTGSNVFFRLQYQTFLFSCTTAQFSPWPFVHIYLFALPALHPHGLHHLTICLPTCKTSSLTCTALHA